MLRVIFPNCQFEFYKFLIFSRDKITDEDLSIIGAEFGHHARNIKQLSLDFSKYIFYSAFFLKIQNL